MPPGPTLDWVGRLGTSESDRGDGYAHQCRTPVALGAQRSPTQVKGGIARVPWLAGTSEWIKWDE